MKPLKMICPDNLGTQPLLKGLINVNRCITFTADTIYSLLDIEKDVLLLTDRRTDIWTSSICNMELLKAIQPNIQVNT